VQDGRQAPQATLLQTPRRRVPFRRSVAAKVTTTDRTKDLISRNPDKGFNIGARPRWQRPSIKNLFVES
jgi:hypothetical protein